MGKDLIFDYEPLWGNWKIDKLLGSGSVGKVYKVYREEYNKKFFSAVKFMSIPTKEQVDIFNNTGDAEDHFVMDNYFSTIIDDMLNEIELLYQLRGNTNIISYEDHLIKKINNKNKWHIMIRMEYVQSIKSYMLTNKLELTEIINLGIEICRALSVCHTNGILHRDIKEENIFISNKGIFKLGDFSVSKFISEKSYAQTKVGTLNYMPPEIIQGKAYNQSADIYSLGIVLYKLLNNKRFPFMPPYPKQFVQFDIESAYIKRLQGHIFPKPLNATDELYEIILKACSFKPENRYKSTYELEKELLKLLNNPFEIKSKSEDSDKTINIFSYENDNVNDNVNDNEIEDSDKTINIFSYENDNVSDKEIDILSPNKGEENKLLDSKPSDNKIKSYFLYVLITATVVTVIISLVLFLNTEPKNKKNLNKVVIENKVTEKIKFVTQTATKTELNTITIKPEVEETIEKTQIITIKPDKETISPTKEPVKSEGIKTSGDNFIKNSGFESGDDTNCKSQSGTGTCTITSTAKYTGNYGASFTNICDLYQRLTIPNDSKYRFWFYVKTMDVVDYKHGARSFIQYYDSNNKLIQKDTTHLYGTNSWKLYEKIIDGKAVETKNLSIYLSLTANGKAYFDDVHFEEIID
ncbi:MAG: serine/threonine-protein kinase [Clostridiales bacterium]